MKLFDLHCDTITECAYKDKDLLKNNLHISLERAKYLEHYAQLFAIWMPDEHRGKAAIEYFDDILAKYRLEMEKNKDIIRPCTTGKELQSALDNGLFASILTVEGGSAVAGKIERVQYLYDCGVRLITLTWNGSNEIANGAHSQKKGGITPFGRRVLTEMEKRHMIIDVSHLNEKGFYDVAAMTKRPFIATHSNCDFVYPHIRNLTNDQIKTIIDRDGLIGMNFYYSFVGGETLDSLYRHIDHLLSLGGEKTASLGGDFDGCTPIKDLLGIELMPNLYEYLLSRNIPQTTVDDIFFHNASHFFIQNLE